MELTSVDCRLRINNSGRCTIPKSVRIALGIQEGDVVQVEVPLDSESYRENGWETLTFTTTVTVKQKYRFTFSEGDLDALNIQETEKRAARWQRLRKRNVSE